MERFDQGKMKGKSVLELEGGETERETPLESKSESLIVEEAAQNGLAIVDLVLRVLAAMATLSSAVVMGTATQTLPLSTQYSQFRAEYSDLPTFTFFVIANSVVCGYLFLCLPLSILRMMGVAAVSTRIILLIFDTVAMGVVTAGASAAASIVYLADKGNAAANWVAFCDQFNSFCQRISGSLIGSFASVLALMLLIIVSAITISRRPP